MSANAVLLGKRTEVIAEYCSPSNEGFLLALAVLAVEITNGLTKIKLYFRSSVN